MIELCIKSRSLITFMVSQQSLSLAVLQSNNSWSFACQTFTSYLILRIHQLPVANMFFSTAVIALLASTFATASPGGGGYGGGGYGHKGTTVCKTSSWVSTSTSVKPTTIYETTTKYVPSTTTYYVPSTTCKTLYKTETKSWVKSSTSKTVSRKKAFHYT